ncbi:MAG TPA: response regulator [Armatimonadota bacterium]|jgi:DNA-binding response OmpR family regulator
MAKILIVEDDVQTSSMVAKALGAKGYRTRIESNGAAALLAAHEDLPDVILMDLMTPILEGEDVLHALRHDPRTAHIPVVILSGRSDTLALAGAITAGANVYLVKPPDLHALYAVVERLATLTPKDTASS